MEAPEDEMSPWQDGKNNYSFINYSVSLYIKRNLRRFKWDLLAAKRLFENAHEKSSS